MERIDRIAKEQNVTFVRRSFLPAPFLPEVAYWRSTYALDRGIVFVEITKRPPLGGPLYPHLVPAKTTILVDLDQLIEQDLAAAVSKALDMKLEHPDDVEIILRLAKIYTRRRLFPEALRELEEARKIDPDNPDIFFYKGAVYAGKGMTRDASEQMSRSVQINPKHVDAWINLGLYQWQLLEKDRAVESTKTALTLLQERDETAGRPFVTATNNLCYFLAERGGHTNLRDAVVLAGQIEDEESINRVHPKNTVAVAATLHTAGFAYSKAAESVQFEIAERSRWAAKAEKLISRAAELNSSLLIYKEDLSRILELRKRLDLDMV